jgi:metallo-beta-lactamase class B
MRCFSLSVLAIGFIAVAVGRSSVSAQGTSTLKPDPPKICDSCDEWNRDKAGNKVFGNTYNVGPDGLSAVLVTSPEGHILLDGALPQSAAIIDRNIRALGFKTEDIRYILNSHGHYDHAGGIAALQRASGARVAASGSTAKALQAGSNTEDDPQYAFGREANAFPPVKNVQVVKDGEVIRIGSLAVTAHLTPGHTPGATTWSWRSCEGETCKDIVYADSLSAVSAPGFLFAADPERVAAFRHSIDTLEALPCDVLIALHPAMAKGMTCKTFAEAARKRLAERLAEERKRP